MMVFINCYVRYVHYLMIIVLVFISLFSRFCYTFDKKKNREKGGANMQMINNHSYAVKNKNSKL